MLLQMKEKIAEWKKNLTAIVQKLADKSQNSLVLQKAKATASHISRTAGKAAKAFCIFAAAKIQKYSLIFGRFAAKYLGALFYFIAKAAAAFWAWFSPKGKVVLDRVALWIELRARKAGHFIGEKLLGLWRGITLPFIKMYRAPRVIWQGFRAGGVRGGIYTLLHGIRRNSYFFTTIFNYAAPVLGVFVLVNVVTSMTNVNYALEVTYNGDHIGYIADEAVLTSAQEMLRQRIIRTDGTQATFELNPILSVVPINASLVDDANTMTDNLIRMSNEDVSQAQGIYIDGEFYGAVTDTANIEQILDDALDKYRTGTEGETIVFIRDIQLREGLYLTNSLVPSAEIEELFLSKEATEITYTIEEGDSPILIADKNGIPYSEFKRLNPDIEKVCLIGQKALIATEKPFLSVKVTRQEVYTESIGYETITTEDDSQYTGYTKTVQEGQNGTQQITASVEYIDGYESTREILNTQVLQEPVDKQVVKGTKEKPTYSRGQVLSASTGTGSYSGNFIWPVGGNGGYISCYYSGGHKALDIACSYGTPIRASAGGRVIVAGWYYTYGKAVVIDHGNGVRTLYAHNSTLNVSVGDYVSQGQQIAGAGSTGYSTGNHCHFEVIINGGRYNPLNYIN